jgi:serine/threonine protein kinase
MEIMLQHTQAKRIPPSQRTELQLSKAFDELIMSCLAKNPDDRPPTAEVLAARLTTVETMNAWTSEHARNWWDIHHPQNHERSEPFLPVRFARGKPCNRCPMSKVCRRHEERKLETIFRRVSTESAASLTL